MDQFKEFGWKTSLGVIGLMAPSRIVDGMAGLQIVEKVSRQSNNDIIQPC